MADHIDIR